MRRSLLAATACALTLSLASGAYAQIDLSWNNCITQPSATANLDYACDGSRDGLPFRLVPSFVSPANLPQFVGVQMLIDVHTALSPNPFPFPAGPAMPDWWKLGVGECHDAGLTLGLVFPASFSGIGTGTTGACQNPFVVPRPYDRAPDSTPEARRA